MKIVFRAMFFLVAALAAIILTYTSCSHKKEELGEQIKIGVILPLTGSVADPGKSALSGIELAFDNHNLAYPAHKIKLIVEDSKSDNKNGVSALNKLISMDDVKLVIGDLMSSVFLSCAPIAEKNKIVMISPGASNPAVKDAGDYIFRNYVSDDFDGEVMANYLYTILKKKRVAVVSVKNDYGIGLSRSFVKCFKKLGGEILLNETYEQGQSDFRSLILKIKLLAPEVVFVAGHPTENGILVKQMKELNVSCLITGNLSFENKQFIDIARGAFDSIIYSTLYFEPDSTEAHVKAFVSNFKEKYNTKPDVAAALGYDVATILTHCLMLSKFDVLKVKDELYQLRNFPGVTGRTTFDKNGDVLKDVFIKKIYGDGKIEGIQFYNISE